MKCIKKIEQIQRNSCRFIFHEYRRDTDTSLLINRLNLDSLNIGLVVRMSILDTKGRQFEPQHQYVFSLGKRLYPHCFSRLNCEMSTRWGQPHEGCSVLRAFRRNST